MAKIIQENEKCIGCGACAALDPSNWEMNGDKAIITDAQLKDGIYTKEVKDASASKDAANACPVQCIKIE
ncbi:MAG: ferredoxin [archaeon]|jgi:ferredoxin